MGVEGVAIATLASQVISSILIVSCLLKTDEIYKLSLKELKRRYRYTKNAIRYL